MLDLLNVTMNNLMDSCADDCDCSVFESKTEIKGDTYIVTVKLPGIAKEDIKLSLIKDQDVYDLELSIKDKLYKFSLPEYDFEPLSGDNIKSSYKDGLLTINIPIVPIQKIELTIE